MIPDFAISELKLKQVPEFENVETLTTGAKTYEWPEMSNKDQTTYLMECDRYGRLLPEGLAAVYCRRGNKWASAQFGTEMFKDTEALKQFITHSLKHTFTKTNT